MMKGADNPSWNIHNTNKCLSKEYYKKRIASSSSDEPPHKKSKLGIPTVGLVYLFQKALKKKLRSA